MWFGVRASLHDEARTPNFRYLLTASAPKGFSMTASANPVIWLVLTLLSLYSTIVIVSVVIELLVYFNIINSYQPWVQKIRLVLFKLTEPVLSRIRRVLPDLGGLDISPIILLIGIQFLEYTIIYYSNKTYAF